MKNTAYDSSAVDTYINELNSREAEITRSMRIQNFKREVPARVFLWCGYAVPIIILILILGFAINKALSFERVEKTVIENSVHGSTNQAENFLSDQVLDVDGILNEEPAFPTKIENEPSEEGVVRNYVIFDRIPFPGEFIKHVVVGREYETPGSQPKESWCYVKKDTYSALEPTFHLVEINGDKRTQVDLTQDMADEFGVPLSELKRAQNKCNI